MLCPALMISASMPVRPSTDEGDEPGVVATGVVDHLAERSAGGDLGLVGGDERVVVGREAGLQRDVEAHVVEVALLLGDEHFDDRRRRGEVEAGQVGDGAGGLVGRAAVGGERRSPAATGVIAGTVSGGAVVAAAVPPVCWPAVPAAAEAAAVVSVVVPSDVAAARGDERHRRQQDAAGRAEATCGRPLQSFEGNTRARHDVGGPDGVEQGEHVVGADADAMAGARDEAQLDAGGRLADGEELLVAVGVDEHFGEQGRAGIGEAGAGEAGVEHLDGDVLHALAVLARGRRQRWARLRPRPART